MGDKEHYYKNREKILAYKRLPEVRKRAAENKKRRYRKNPQKYTAYVKDWKHRHPENTRIALRKCNYKITQEWFAGKLRAQNYRCAICLKVFKQTPHVDHDHSCCPQKGKSCGKCVRGLLCAYCNSGLGGFQDNILVLRSAIEYVKVYGKPRKYPRL